MSLSTVHPHHYGHAYAQQQATIEAWRRRMLSTEASDDDIVRIERACRYAAKHGGFTLGVHLDRAYGHVTQAPGLAASLSYSIRRAW